MPENFENKNGTNSFLQSLKEYNKKDMENGINNKKEILEVFSTNGMDRYVKVEDYLKYFDKTMPTEDKLSTTGDVKIVTVPQEKIEEVIKTYNLILKLILLRQKDRGDSPKDPDQKDPDNYDSSKDYTELDESER